MNKSNNLKPSLDGLRLSLWELQAEKARRSFYEFVRQAWSVLEPSTAFVDGIHIRAICVHLQAVTEGRIGHLIINVPPGHAKSLLCAVFWPAWVWIDRAQTRWIFASYAASLSARDSVKCRRLIESEWYQRRWGDRYHLRGDQNQKHRFENDCTGYRIATSVGGSATGERADIVVVDDPHSVDQAESDIERRTAVEWFNGTMCTRLNDFTTGHKIVVQQRLHERDVSGDLLVKGGFELLCLPAEFEQERRCTTAIGWTDPRVEPGELLWPQKISAAQLKALKVSLGSYRYAGQYQQRPSPAEGGIFKQRWWRFWRPAHIDLPPVAVRLPDGGMIQIHAIAVPAQFDTMIQSWDMTFKANASSDYVVGQVWGAKGADRFLLDQCRARLDLPGTKEALRSLSERWPKATAKLVEDKANGPAVLQELGHQVEGLIGVTPEGGKIARAHAVSPIVESGNVYLPHPAIAPWVEEFIAEVSAFPNGRHDDQVDAMTQALNRLRQGGGGRFHIPESQIVIDPFVIPEEWPRGFGMALHPSGLGAVWGARDPDGSIYLYAEHLCSHAEPSENARALKQRGDWIPGVLSSASLPGSLNTRNGIAEVFRRQGLTIHAAQAEQAAVYALWQLLATKRLRIFTSLAGLLTAYRIGDDEAALLRACEALISSDYMRTKPTPRVQEYQLLAGPGDRLTWMT